MDGGIKKTLATIRKTMFCMIIILVVSGCTISKAKFIKKISKMPDENLIHYYHGINERIKDIGNTIRTKKRSDFTEHDLAVVKEPFIFGGEAYNLEQKRQLLLAELYKRNISPEIHR